MNEWPGYPPGVTDNDPHFDSWDDDGYFDGPDEPEEDETDESEGDTWDNRDPGE